MGTFLSIVIVVIACIIFIPKIRKATEREKAEERRKAEVEAAKQAEERRKDEADKVKALEQSALQGDVFVQYQLGERYRSDGNLEESIKWFKKAADNGHEKAEEVLPVVIADYKSGIEAKIDNVGKRMLEIEILRGVVVKKCFFCDRFRYQEHPNGNFSSMVDFSNSLSIGGFTMCLCENSPYYDFSTSHPNVNDSCSFWEISRYLGDLSDDRLNSLKEKIAELVKKKNMSV